MSLRAAVLEARAAARALAALDAERRSALLAGLAEALDDPATRREVLTANAEDLAAAREAEARGELAPALVKRLGLDGTKLDAVSDGLRQLAALPDLVGQVTAHRELDAGLILKRVTCPLGVLGVVFEARPDALVQITGLAWKSGNAAVLKGGREARASNRALATVARRVLGGHGLDPGALLLLEDRSEVDALLGLNGLIDLVIARGSSGFVRHVRASTRIPVMAHADGICHLYLHAPADPAMAAKIAVDAKTSYPAACNSIETLLWDTGSGEALDACVEALARAGVELRGCPATRERHPELLPARDLDWDTEYGALILAIKKVDGLDGALAHVAAHGSRHTEAIVTDDEAAAARFLAEVDAAGVFHNASTRFADGYRFGLGAEVGISTDKLHARGPVGVEGLLTYRWLLQGSGHAAADYGPGRRRFTHRDL
ncbi:MAG TPA: glutamate-5-semialdehyde dehydrogenase [Thermoanaerobaculia bacterium]|nr:glutamate-5-semialdehyde dehydrogenase [Thermoanaerobaculia bacterium]